MIQRCPTPATRLMKGGIALKTYEIICILNPTLAVEAVDEKIENWQNIIQQGGGEITKVSRWGKRNLAYEVNKQKQGIFVLMHLKSGHAIKDEIERQFKISDDVIKFQSVVLTERQTKLSELVVDRVQSSTTSFQRELIVDEDREERPHPRSSNRFPESDNEPVESGDDDEEFGEGNSLPKDSEK